MSESPVLYEKAGRLGFLTLNRPAKLNAIDDTLLGAFDAALEEARLDEAVSLVVIRGAGRAFSVGQDLSGEGMRRLTGRQFTAEEGLRYGLVTKVVPAADLDDEILTVAEALLRSGGMGGEDHRVAYGVFARGMSDAAGLQTAWDFTSGLVALVPSSAAASVPTSPPSGKPARSAASRPPLRSATGPSANWGTGFGG